MTIDEEIKKTEREELKTELKTELERAGRKKAQI